MCFILVINLQQVLLFLWMWPNVSVTDCQLYSPGTFQQSKLDSCPEYDFLFITMLEKKSPAKKTECNASTQPLKQHNQRLNDFYFSTNRNSNKSALMKAGGRQLHIHVPHQAEVSNRLFISLLMATCLFTLHLLVSLKLVYICVWLSLPLYDSAQHQSRDRVKTFCSEEIYCTVSMVTSCWPKPYLKAKCCFLHICTTTKPHCWMCSHRSAQ